MAQEPISVREVILRVLASDKYPCYNILDCQYARGLEKDALEKADSAIPSPDDPPDFSRWLEVLRQPDLTIDGREAIYDEIHDYFEPEGTPGMGS
jgi:hypothetical protein